MTEGHLWSLVLSTEGVAPQEAYLQATLYADGTLGIAPPQP